MSQPRVLTVADILDFPPLGAWRVGAATPDLSADGRRVVYVHAGHVYVVAAAAGQARLLA